MHEAASIDCLISFLSTTYPQAIREPLWGWDSGYPNPLNFLARYAKLVNEDFLIFRFVYINTYTDHFTFQKTSSHTYS